MVAETINANREERVLTLLHLLGPQTAEHVLNCLDAETSGKLQSQMKTFADRLPPVRRQTQVIEEFERFFRFAVGSGRPGLKLHSPGEDAEDEADDVYQPSGDPLVDLEKMNEFQLASALNEEQPRTVALLLKVVTPKRVAQLLNLIDPQRRETIVQELSRDPRAPELILRKIAGTTVNRAATLPSEPTKKEDPVQRLVDVLRETEKSQRRQILTALEQQDPDQAAKINQSLYRFEDLAALEDQQIQKILSRVDSATLSTALFGADETILNKIMSNLSKRARASLQEELSFRKNVPPTQLRASRELVIHAIAEADQETE